MGAGGYFTVAEASRVTRIPRSTLDYWSRTGVVTASQRQARPRLYSFLDLRDLRVAQELRDQGAKSGEIAAAIGYLRSLSEGSKEHARLAGGAELALIGGRVVIRDRARDVGPLQPSKGGHHVLAVTPSKIFDDLSEIPASLTELRPAPGVVIDPEVRGGTPVLEGTRVPASVIAELIAGDVPVEEILEMYPSLDEQAIKAAVDWEAALHRRAVAL